MKYKYSVSLSEDKKELQIQECGELDKDSFSVLCEETYDSTVLKSIIEKGGRSLGQVLRTENFFPPGLFMEKINETVAAVFESDSHQPMELFCDDAEFIRKEKAEREAEADGNASDADIDEMLEDDDADSDYDDDNSLTDETDDLPDGDDNNR